MVTEKTIENLEKKTKNAMEKRAVEELTLMLGTYRRDKNLFASESSRKIKGYRTSSEIEMRRKTLTRAEEGMKSGKQLLNEIGYNKSNPLIYYYILANPGRKWDYYFGLTQDFIPFESDEWKQRMIKKIWSKEWLH